MGLLYLYVHLRAVRQVVRVRIRFHKEGGVKGEYMGCYFA